MPNPDRVSKNDSDGQVFYGYDEKETNTTTWYSEDGQLDCITEKPFDDEEE